VTGVGEQEKVKKKKIKNWNMGVRDLGVVPAFLAGSESESSTRPRHEKGAHETATAWDFHHSQRRCLNLRLSFW
jgi:hypothetical protein